MADCTVLSAICKPQSRLGSDSDVWSNLVEEHRTNTFDIAKIFHGRERAVGGAILDDSFGKRLADTRQTIKLGSAGGVDIDQLILLRVRGRSVRRAGGGRFLAQARH